MNISRKIVLARITCLVRLWASKLTVSAVVLGLAPASLAQEVVNDTRANPPAPSQEVEKLSYRTKFDPNPERILQQAAEEAEASIDRSAFKHDDDDVVPENFRVEAPEVVQLGWGWSQSRAVAIPTVCITFDVQSNAAQTSNISIKEVTDSYSLAKQMNVSASVSMTGFGAKVDGKASFAKNSKVSSTSVSYLVQAEVLNGASFVAPKRSDSSGVGRAVRLTDAAEALALEDPEAFQRICGDGYILATISGARAYLLAVTKTTSKSERTAVKASVTGSGWGQKASAAMSGSSESGTESFQRDLTFFQQGGSAPLGAREAEGLSEAEIEQLRKDAVLPDDAETAIARIKRLAFAAADAGKVFEIEISPYEALANFPPNVRLMAEEDEHDQLVALWGAYTTIYDDLVTAMANPDLYGVPIKTCDAGTCTVDFQPVAEHMQRVGAIQDMALVAMATLEGAAEECLENAETCNFQEDLVRSPYSVYANMPVPLIKSAEGEAPVKSKAKTPTKADHTSIYLRDQAAGRCQLGSGTPGCISNAMIEAWALRTGMISSQVEDAAATVKRYPNCMAQRAMFIGDANNDDAEILWHPVNIQIDAVAGAVVDCVAPAE